MLKNLSKIILKSTFHKCTYKLMFTSKFALFKPTNQFSFTTTTKTNEAEDITNLMKKYEEHQQIANTKSALLLQAFRIKDESKIFPLITEILELPIKLTNNQDLREYVLNN